MVLTLAHYWNILSLEEKKTQFSDCLKIYGNYTRKVMSKVQLYYSGIYVSDDMQMLWRKP